MILFPVAERELRVAARQNRIYWERSLWALAALLVLGWMNLSFGGWGTLAEKARVAFFGLSTVAMIFAGMAGVILTSDSVGEERREGTLGLLFLTDLKGWDIILGKLAANALGAFLSLLTMVPVLMLPLLMGGVAAMESLRMALLLGGFTLFSLCLGLASSVLFTNPKVSRSVTFLGMILLTAGGPLVYMFVEGSSRMQGFPIEYLFKSSPCYSLGILSDVRFGAERSIYWTHVAGLFSGALGLLYLAARRLPNSWQDRPKGAVGAARAEKVAERQRGKNLDKQAERREMLDMNPVFWLASRGGLHPAWVYGALGLMSGGMLWALLEQDPAFYLDGAAACLFTLGGTVFKWLMGAFAGRVLEEDFRSGSIELILSTPLKVEEILSGHLMSAKRQFLVAGCIFAALVAALASFGSMHHDGLEVVLFCLAQLIVFGADMVALAWVGLWMAVQGKKPGRAAGSAVFRILILPGILFMGAGPFMGGIASSLVLPTLWFCGCLMHDFVQWQVARDGLNRHFREKAMARFQPSGAK